MLLTETEEAHGEQGHDDQIQPGAVLAVVPPSCRQLCGIERLAKSSDRLIGEIESTYFHFALISSSGVQSIWWARACSSSAGGANLPGSLARIPISGWAWV